MVTATWTAKYFASCRAFAAAADTVQIVGAHGCVPGHPAGRLLRDAKIMEIIEGSTQIQQIYLAQAAFHRAAFDPTIPHTCTFRFRELLRRGREDVRVRQGQPPSLPPNYPALPLVHASTILGTLAGLLIVVLGLGRRVRDLGWSGW
jgi:Acyl-CoA dehydrogenase, C-terminal domain